LTKAFPTDMVSYITPLARLGDVMVEFQSEATEIILNKIMIEKKNTL